jgi:hypothetical protein
MPLELGLFLGARHWERGKIKKIALILDLEPHRYQIFCSDIAGQDIQVQEGANRSNKGRSKLASIR